MSNYTPHSTRRGVAIWQLDTEKEQSKINDILNYVQNQKLDYYDEVYTNYSKERGKYYEYVIYAFLDDNDIESFQ